MKLLLKLFLERKIKFTDIAKTIEHVLSVASISEGKTLQQVLDDDQQARDLANNYIS
jgi:1-deoxy-D-xylulose 5-phosphate reductoisomerase